MKVVILAGGFGTRISEESAFKPKPMIEIGGMPILWHIMKNYSYYGFNEFVICAGYKQHVIKEWFADYFLHTSDITFDYTNGSSEMIVHNKHMEPWKVIRNSTKEYAIFLDSDDLLKKNSVDYIKKCISVFNYPDLLIYRTQFFNEYKMTIGESDRIFNTERPILLDPKETDTGIRFDDPDIAIEWPVNESAAIHSNRDMKLLSFAGYMHSE